MQDHESTPIGRRVAEIAAQHPGNSAFQIIRYGRPAFTARIALADVAQKTLDVQYFLWKTDATGRNLVDHLVRAADRSVRVRILIDDFNLKDLDATIAALDAHPNIEVRLFNPFAHRGSHLIGFLTDFERVNHRMHNKLMVTDNAIAIVGGRNMRPRIGAMPYVTREWLAVSRKQVTSNLRLTTLRERDREGRHANAADMPTPPREASASGISPH